MPVQEIFLPVLAIVVGPVQNIFFRTVRYFTSLVPIGPASWAGSRTASPVSGDHCPQCPVPRYILPPPPPGSVPMTRFAKKMGKKKAQGRTQKRKQMTQLYSR